MSTVTPPPPPVPPAPLGGIVNTSALLLSAPAQTLQALQALQTGQNLQATLASMPTANTAQVQTALGLITLQTTLSLPRDAVLTLVVSNPTSLSPNSPNLGQVSFQISAINGKPVMATALNANTTQAATPPTPPLSPGQTLSATLLRPALGIAQNVPPVTTTALAGGQGAPIVPTGTPGITQAATPSVLAAPRPGATTPATLPIQGSTAGAPPTTATPPATTPAITSLATGTRFSVTIQAIETPNAAVTTPASLTAEAGAKTLATGQVITGTVTGSTVGGQAIVQTHAATFALGNAGAPGSQNALSEGTKITFRLDSAPLSSASLSPAAAATDQLRSLAGTHSLITAKTWDDLGEALKALVAADPARLAQVAQNALPQPGAKLSSQMLFFLSALKGGELNSLFGDTASRVIDKERPGLLSRMGSDFQTMSRLADEPQQNDWRLALIPLWTGEKLEQLRLFWRNGGGEEGGEEGEETRFVLDVDLSNLGHLQIDGLVKAKRHHLDLIIRTDQPLPAEMRTDIGQLFENARDILGLGGQVAFQAAPANFIATPGAAAGPGALPGGPMASPSAGLLA
ncbi:MAG: hypothetical protein NUV50_05040 [Rhodospirillales bacterium]|nr:hypothetical protein [Rhodospirillales bacterium]